MSNNDKEPNEALEEKQIKNAVIDLLHYNEAVTHEAIAKTTGLSIANIRKHSTSIESMLAKLKKIHTSPNFKS